MDDQLHLFSFADHHTNVDLRLDFQWRFTVVDTHVFFRLETKDVSVFCLETSTAAARLSSCIADGTILEQLDSTGASVLTFSEFMPQPLARHRRQ